MAVRQTILRYIHVLNKLRKAPATFKEIDQYLSQQSNLQDEKFNVSKRQFQRDLKDISSIFELEIIYDSSNGVYRINENEISEISKRRMEAFDTFNALRIGENTSDLIHFENRKPLGTENLFGLIHAIKNRLKINFTYQKFWEDESTDRIADPLALKEFKNRWYLLAKDHKDNAVKTFGLDRISALEISRTKFKVPAEFDVEKQFRYSFGIISPNDKEPQEIALAFDAFQGKYIKTLPLHHTQQILVDNKDELQVKLKVCVTYDFIQELLSFGDRMKVLQPPSLVTEIKSAQQKAFKQYK